MKKILSFLLWSVMSSSMAATTMQVFVSFSMPEVLLRQTLMESAQLHIPAILNGLYHNSMPETTAKIATLVQDVPQLNLQIDPTAFERFGIHQVPALVVSTDKGFDVLYGNLSLKAGLYRLADNSKSHLHQSGVTHADVRRYVGE